MRLTLPPAEYVSGEAYRLEEQRIFRRAWQVAAPAAQLATQNDWVALEIGGQSVVVQRFDDGLHAFHNVCAHRQNRLRNQPCGNGRLECGYHGWIYDRHGQAHIPNRTRFASVSDQELAGLRLTPWRVEQVGPMVFVCPDPLAPPLRTWLGELGALVLPFLEAAGEVLDENDFEVSANWKVLVENGLEVEHVACVHPESLAPHGLLEKEVLEFTAGSLSRFETKTSGKTGRVLDRLFPDRPIRDHLYVHALVFPCLYVVSVYGAFFIVTRILPIAPERTRFTSWVLASKADPISEALSPARAMFVRSNVDFVRSGYAEDVDICEQVQRGLREASRPGPLGAWERRIATFQDRRAEWLERA